MIEVLEAEFHPIRARREEFAKDPEKSCESLKQGSEKAEKSPLLPLAEVKEAMGIRYFIKTKNAINPLGAGGVFVCSIIPGFSVLLAF